MPQPESARHPNILVIHCDQLRADCVGAYGSSEVRTPHIDALAADAVRYDQHFCAYPVCTPSRYSLLSGKPVHEHRGWTNYCTLHPQIATFPGILRDAEYRTTAVGKMHFTPTYLDVGFDRMILAEQDGPGRWDDDYHRDLRDAGLIDAHDLEDQRAEYREDAPREYWETAGARASNLPHQWHSTEWIAERALRELASWNAQSNLLMVGFVKPHHPFDPPREFADRYDPSCITPLGGWTEECPAHDLRKNPGYFPNDRLTETMIRGVTAHYYATIEHIDIQVGRLVATLKQKGLYDDTLIVFTSDHGEYLGFHHMLTKGSYLYEPLLRVPLLIKFPGPPGKGAIRPEPTCNTDVAPTLLLQALASRPDGMSGCDLSCPIDAERLVFAEADLGAQFLVRSRRYKLIQDRGAGEAFLFDLETDPYELQNVYRDAAHASEAARLEHALGTWSAGIDRPVAYLDEDAPEIAQPNVPRKNDGHREAMVEYTRTKMTEYRNVL